MAETGGVSPGPRVWRRPARELLAAGSAAEAEQSVSTKISVTWSDCWETAVGERGGTIKSRSNILHKNTITLCLKFPIKIKDTRSNFSGIAYKH